MESIPEQQVSSSQHAEPNKVVLVVPYILTIVSDFLSVRDIVNVSLTCREAQSTLIGNGKMWRRLLLRDFKPYLETMSLEEEAECARENPISIYARMRPIADDPQDAEKMFTGAQGEETLRAHLRAKIKRTEEDVLKIASENPLDTYKELSATARNAFGARSAFMGDYATHGLESIRVVQYGYLLVAIKETGDVNVPTGKITFEVVLSRSLLKGEGRIHLADTGFLHPRQGYCQLCVKNRDQIVVNWMQDNQIYIDDSTLNPMHPIILIPLCLWRADKEEARFSEQMKLISFTDQYSQEFSVICVVNF